MAHSPGHRKWPEHQVREERLDGRVQVVFGGETVADSHDVVKVSEDDYPPRYYFPRTDVIMDDLQRTERTTQCPFKGRANYYSLRAGGRTAENAVWTYEEPYEEHQGLAGRLAFDDELVDDIVVENGQGRA